MKHTRAIQNRPGSHEQPAQGLGKLWGHALAEFPAFFSARMARGATAGESRDRPKRAAELEAWGAHPDLAAGHVQTAWAMDAPRGAAETDSPPAE